MLRIAILALILAGVSPALAADGKAPGAESAPVLAAVPASAATPAPAPADAPSQKLAGAYQSESGRRAVIRITPVGDGALQVRSDEGWTSVGFLNGSRFEGVLRYQRASRGGDDGLGTLRFDAHADASIEAEIWPPGTEARRSRETWSPVNVPGAGIVPAPPSTPGAGPALSYERPPMPRSWAKPDYPAAARQKKIEGTVVVDALVGIDGKVKQTRIANSIPELDEAAEKAARKWRFEPALADGKPVEAWVPVPVRFSLK